MKPYLIFIVFFMIIIVRASGQNNILKYLLVEVYTDGRFKNIDTAKHRINIYSIKGNKKEEVSELPNQIFHFKKIKRRENFLFEIDNKVLDINIKMLRSELAVLKVYINSKAINNNVYLVIKNGDAICELGSCTQCHRIELIPLAVIIDRDRKVTTEYKVLDDFLFN